MQVFELILYVMVVIELYFFYRRTVLPTLHVIVLTGFVSGVFLCHMLFDSIKWQAIPLYGSVFLITVSLLLIGFTPLGMIRQKRYKLPLLILSTILILVSMTMTYVFPIKEMPNPTGDYEIGTQSFVWTDTTRDEHYGEEDHRRIKVQMWYPAESTEGYEVTPWIEDGTIVTKAIARQYGLPAFALNHTSLIESHSYKDAPIKETYNTYPVVILSHGWKGFRNLHTDVAEELASIGYLVVGIDHTYGSVATVFGEDDISYVNTDALPEGDQTTNYSSYSNALVSTYASDILFVLDELELLHSGDIPSQFENVIDLNNIGLLGHSTGGGAGVQAAINDNRIKAVFGMDSWVEPLDESLIEVGLNIPCLFLRSEEWQGGSNDLTLNRLVDDNLGNTRLYQLKSTLHNDFSMAYMYSPLSDDFGFTGDLEGTYLLSIYRSMMRDFFDQTLKVDNNVGLIIIHDEWPELYKIK